MLGLFHDKMKNKRIPRDAGVNFAAGCEQSKLVWAGTPSAVSHRPSVCLGQLSVPRGHGVTDGRGRGGTWGSGERWLH